MLPRHSTHGRETPWPSAWPSSFGMLKKAIGHWRRYGHKGIVHQMHNPKPRMHTLEKRKHCKGVASNKSLASVL
jgi:hypothetical protein